MMPNVYKATNLLLDYLGKSHCLWISRCTTAIYVILKAISGNNKQVVVPSNICLSVIAAIKFSGNTPYLLDISMASQSIDPDSLTCLDSKKDVVVIYPHMYGICHSDVIKIHDICKNNGWFLIEDCAQALGGEINGYRVGYWGDVSVFSFGAGKIIDCGYGGAIVTDDVIQLNEFSSIYNSIPTGGNGLSSREQAYGEIFKKLYSIGESLNNIDLFLIYDSLLETFRDIFIYRKEDLPFKKIHKALLNLDENLIKRIERAEFLKKKFNDNGINFLKHPNGSTYWRFNVLLAPNIRNRTLSLLHNKGLHASSWFPSVDKYFQTNIPRKKKIFVNCDVIGGGIINLWINDQINTDYLKQTSNIIIKSNSTNWKEIEKL